MTTTEPVSGSDVKYASPLHHFRSRNYLFYVLTRTTATLALSTLNLVVAWTIYDVSGNPIYLGLAGLILFVPNLLLVLVVGMVADHFPRQRVLSAAYLMLALCAFGMAWLAWSGNLQPVAILSLLGIVGIARAFVNPTVKALLVNIVDRQNLPSAIALNASLTKISVVSGPIVGGLLYAVSPTFAFGFSTVVFAVAVVLTLSMRATGQVAATTVKARDLLGGLAAIRTDKALIGAITLDFFVMFISGATALLPVFAKDILHTDAVGLGFLRSAPAIGAFLMAGLLAWRPIQRNAGTKMLLCVAGYGVSILIFGMSTAFWLSWFMLLAGGCLDMVSVNIRESMVQLRTPDHLRGRVTSVNGLFIAASNELGDFRAGSFAVLFGAVPAVLFGGVAALTIAGA